jgi:putative chitinase
LVVEFESAKDMIMNRDVFYDAVRTSLFAGKLSHSQVDGMENLLDVWDKYFANDHSIPNPTDHLAYDLGTAFHETARSMQPITEYGQVAYFDKYEPGTKLGEQLGNTEKGDGYRFRGEGHVQNTGRRNASKATTRLNELFHLGIDLVADPEKRRDPFVSAMSLFLGNKEGWWTGRKLGDYLTAGRPDFVNARRVVNGTDKAATIAGYAAKFKTAIQAAAKAG